MLRAPAVAELLQHCVRAGWQRESLPKEVVARVRFISSCIGSAALLENWIRECRVRKEAVQGFKDGFSKQAVHGWY